MQKLHQQEEVAWDVEGRVRGIVSRIREETMSGSKSNASDNPCWRRWKQQNKN